MVSFSSRDKMLPSQTGREITPSFGLSALHNTEHRHGALTFLAGTTSPVLGAGKTSSTAERAQQWSHATSPGESHTGIVIRVVTSPSGGKSFHHSAVYAK